MIDKYTAQARTKEEAIEKALHELGISREEAEVEVNSLGKKGFLGIGQKDAVVTVKRKKSLTLDDVMLTESREETESTPAEKPAVGDKPVQEDQELEQAAEYAKEQAAMPPISADAVEEAAEGESEKADFQEADSREEEAVEEVEEQAVTPPPSVEEIEPEKEVNEQDEEAIEQVRLYLHDILIHMGIEDAEISVNRSQERVLYEVNTADAGLVIGKHGKVLNGLQTLVQIQLHQLAETKLFAKVDAENYRSRRKETVEQLAKKTADKVKKTKQPVILEPMPAHERKQIHRYLHRETGIKTYSEGKEPHRYLVVEPVE